MNYRHAFHAGNFADLIKHAALLLVMERLLARDEPLQVVDTHSGRGIYDVGNAEASRSGEARAGIGRLATATGLPAGLEILRSDMEALNRAGVVSIYPGSPQLIASRLRPGDSYLACELRPEEHSALAEAMQGRAGVRTACADGFDRASSLGPAEGQALVLIDPPFERADDYARIAEVLRSAGRRAPALRFLIWLPLKDLETLDSFLRSIEDAELGSILVVEARMRPLMDPMKMNGCALVLVRPIDGIEDSIREVVEWVVGNLGESGEARLWRL